MDCLRLCHLVFNTRSTAAVNLTVFEIQMFTISGLWGWGDWYFRTSTTYRCHYYPQNFELMVIIVFEIEHLQPNSTEAVIMTAVENLIALHRNHNMALLYLVSFTLIHALVSSIKKKTVSRRYLHNMSI